jgi:hypothetical protein
MRWGLNLGLWLCVVFLPKHLAAGWLRMFMLADCTDYGYAGPARCACVAWSCSEMGRVGDRRGLTSRSSSGVRRVRRRRGDGELQLSEGVEFLGEQHARQEAGGARGYGVDERWRG